MEEHKEILLIYKYFTCSFEQDAHHSIWKVSRDLVDMGHHVTIVCEGSLSGCENSFMKEGIILTELPYISIGKRTIFDELFGERLFNLAALKWVRKFGHQFDVIQFLGKNNCMPKCEIKNALVTGLIRGLVTERKIDNAPGRDNFYSSIFNLFREKVRETGQ